MKKFLSVFLSVCLLCGVISPAVCAAGSEEEMNIYGIYLTHEGDATLIESNGEWLLIDAGLDKDASTGEDLTDELIGALEAHNIDELSVMISHIHLDHWGGFEALSTSGVTINALYLPEIEIEGSEIDTTRRTEKLTEQVRANNPDAEVITLSATDTASTDNAFTFGNVNATVLGPVGTYSFESFEAEEHSYIKDTNPPDDHYLNNRSLVVRFDCGETSFLSAGDIEKAEEDALLKKYGGTGELDCDIMKLSHHALYTSNSEKFIDAVSPLYSFSQNSGKGQAPDSNYRQYYNSLKNASKHGVVYLVGEEKKECKISAKGGSIDIYKGTAKLEGLVSLAGGDGNKVTENTYYINPANKTEGIKAINGNKYYIYAGGLVAKPLYSFNYNDFVRKIDFSDGTRYFDLEGRLLTGFQKTKNLKDGSTLYNHFNSSTGIMTVGKSGWAIIKIGSKRYAINENGSIYTASFKGGWLKISGNMIYVNSSGELQLGFKKINGYTYYFNPTSGYKTLGKKGWAIKTIGGKKYALNENGVIYNGSYKGGWLKFGKKYRYFDKTGVMKTGWLTLKGKKYYLDPKTGYRTVGLKKIGKKTYYFVEKKSAAYLYTANGKGGWKTFGKKYRYFNKKGVMKTGWFTLKGKTYYLNKKTGYRTVGLKKIGKKTYYFVEKKRAAYRWSGWKSFGKKKRYFDKKGVMAVGKKKIGGKTYRFNKKGFKK